jgi:hypothetical protein
MQVRKPHIPVNSATRSNSNPPLIPVKIRHMNNRFI